MWNTAANLIIEHNLVEESIRDNTAIIDTAQVPKEMFHVGRHTRKECSTMSVPLQTLHMHEITSFLAINSNFYLKGAVLLAYCQ